MISKNTVKSFIVQGACSQKVLRLNFHNFLCNITIFRKLPFTKHSEEELSCYFLRNSKTKIPLKFLRKDCFQNKSKFIIEDQFTEHTNITTL
jgi:hypothetical protein